MWSRIQSGDHQINSPFCKQTAPVKKHGRGSSGHQRYRCQACCRSFQL
ncbi:MAG: IS1/IS1595 family N-terminal zinc-binding domain-containing protein, partial [Yersinia sp. (in: enterobacteria)]